jgi:P27 family predicted phage terminase small subunit
MGKRGPPPDPSVIQMLKGNPSKKGVNRDEPKPEAVPENFPPPPELEGRTVEIWHEMVKRASDMRVLTQADIPTLTRYCIERDLYLRCYEKVKIGGEEFTVFEVDPNTQKTRIKFTQVAPWATQMHRHHAACLRIEQEFGMTPSSRSQVKTHGSAGPASPLAQWAARHSAG